MTQTIDAETRRVSTTVVRQRVRWGAGALAAVISLLYFALGLGVVTVMGNSANQEALGRTAGAAFLLVAVAVVAFDHRAMWGAAVAAQIFVIWSYLDLASARTPSFEAWGMTIVTLEIALLAGLLYLTLGPKRGRDVHRP